MTKRQVVFLALGIICVLVLVSTMYFGTYIVVYHRDDWWTLPTVFLLFGIFAGSGIGGTFLFMETFR